MTLSARGQSLTEALSQLDAAAPMRMHYGQVRLLVFSRETAESAGFSAALEELASMPEFSELCSAEERRAIEKSFIKSNLLNA